MILQGILVQVAQLMTHLKTAATLKMKMIKNFPVKTNHLKKKNLRSKYVIMK